MKCISDAGKKSPPTGGQKGVKDSLRGNDFEEAAEKYRDHIYAVAFNFFRNSSDADDVVQDVLLKLYRSQREFESDEHVRNWLLRVAVNHCRKISVSSWFKKNIPLEEYAASLEYETPEESDLFFAVMALPKKYRIIVHLFYYEDYSTREIAEMLRLKEPTVRTRLLRARKLLKERLSDVWNEE